MSQLIMVAQKERFSLDTLRGNSRNLFMACIRESLDQEPSTTSSLMMGAYQRYQTAGEKI